MKLKLGKAKKFKDVKIGHLFMNGLTIALKTEYSTDHTADAYIVGTGEYWWGGTNDRRVRDEIEVIELKLR